jgi:hypothetical protein
MDLVPLVRLVMHSCGMNYKSLYRLNAMVEKKKCEKKMFHIVGETGKRDQFL